MEAEELDGFAKVNIQDALEVQSRIVAMFKKRGASHEATRMAEKVGNDFLDEVFRSGVRVRDKRHMDYRGAELGDYFDRCAKAMLIVFLDGTEATLGASRSRYSNWAVFQEFRKIVRSL